MVLFFQDTLHLTERFAVVGGVRYMDYDQLAGKGRPFVTNTNVSADKVLPLGGAIFKLTDQVSLYASYTQSLKPNSTIAPLARRRSGRARLATSRPRRARNTRPASSFDLNKRISGTVAVYDIEKRNVLVVSADRSGDQRRTSTRRPARYARAAPNSTSPAG